MNSGLTGRLAAGWGVLGFSLLICAGLVRLAERAIESLGYSWSAWHVALLLVNVAAMAWFEGYRGFQCSFSPRFAARARYLADHATPAQAVLAPLVLMGYICAPRRRILGAWLLTAGIVAIVLLYRTLDQPLRGVMDAGVVVGLGWGLVATLLQTRAALVGEPQVDAEIA